MSNSRENFHYQKRMTTAITLEKSVPGNPYAAQQRYTAGYEHSQLVGQLSGTELLLLQLKGERPEPMEVRLLDGLLVALGNLGPRHYAIRSAMVAGLSKTRSEHLLPIGLMSAGGKSDGCQEVQASYDFIHRRMQQPLTELASYYQGDGSKPEPTPPGFGSSYGLPDAVLESCALRLLAINPDASVIKWCVEFVESLKRADKGWLASGLCAAVCLQLNIGERESVAVYQLAIAPGILSHALEQTHRPITAGPMLSDSEYELQKN